MDKSIFDKRLAELYARYEKTVRRKNEPMRGGNGVFERFRHPVLTKDHIPVFWKYDLDFQTNPHLMERLGVNSVFNAGAIELDGKILLVARVEGNECRKPISRA